VFIANGGGDKSGYDGATYSGGPDRAYNEILCGYESLGTLRTGWVTGEADLVFEIRFTVFQPEHSRGLNGDDPAKMPSCGSSFETRRVTKSCGD